MKIYQGSVGLMLAPVVPMVAPAPTVAPVAPMAITGTMDSEVAAGQGSWPMACPGSGVRQ